MIVNKEYHTKLTIRERHNTRILTAVRVKIILRNHQTIPIQSMIFHYLIKYSLLSNGSRKIVEVPVLSTCVNANLYKNFVRFTFGCL